MVTFPELNYHKDQMDPILLGSLFKCCSKAAEENFGAHPMTTACFCIIITGKGGSRGH